jgi:hypothetical protein
VVAEPSRYAVDTIVLPPFEKNDHSTVETQNTVLREVIFPDSVPYVSVFTSQLSGRGHEFVKNADRERIHSTCAKLNAYRFTSADIVKHLPSTFSYPFLNHCHLRSLKI